VVRRAFQLPLGKLDARSIASAPLAASYDLHFFAAQHAAEASPDCGLVDQERHGKNTSEPSFKQSRVL
jgi:hypothetical protein